SGHGFLQRACGTGATNRTVRLCSRASRASALLSLRRGLVVNVVGGEPFDVATWSIDVIFTRCEYWRSTRAGLTTCGANRRWRHRGDSAARWPAPPIRT